MTPAQPAFFEGPPPAPKHSQRDAGYRTWDATEPLDDLIAHVQKGSWESLKDACTGGPWLAEAACTESEPDIFFVEGDEPGTDGQLDLSGHQALEDALSICGRCPQHTQASCLVRALEDGDEYGVRGGLSATARQPLHKAWRERVDEEKVAAAVRGERVALTEAERARVIALYVEQPHWSASAIARGTGINRGLLAWHAHQSRRKRGERSCGPADASAA